MRDYYAILGVDRDADAEEIKTAFRKLAMNYHPDRNPGDAWAERRFKEVNEAYETLGEEELRARYDATADFESSDLAETPVSEDAGWTEPPAEGERFWEDEAPAADPPAPTRRVSPWVSAAIVAASLVLVSAAIVLLALAPDVVEFDKIANQPLNAPEPAVDEARAVPPETPSPVAPTLLNGRDAKAPAETPDQAPSSETVPVEPARVADDPVETEWTRLEGTRDPASLARFIAQHPDTPRANEALAAATELIEAETDEPRLLALLDDAPPGAVADRARARLDRLREQAASAEDNAWEAAVRQGSAAGFRAFLEQYPSARRVGEAKAKLESLGLIEIAVGTAAGSEKRWLRAIDAFRDCPTCPPMVVARARKTAPPDFDAKVRAALPEPYAIAKSRVTAREWAECVRDGGCAAQPESAAAQFGLSFRDAQRYAGWLRRKTGHAYRLVTELEWRYAVRLKLVTIEGGADAARGFAGRSALDDAPPPFADQSREPRATPERGGMAFEWVSDCWTDGGRREAANETQAPSADDGLCSERVLLARRGREFERFGDTPGSGQAGYAFRVARTLE